MLARHGLVVDEDSRKRLNAEVRKAEADAALRLGQNALGDYRPDEYVKRFPPVEIVDPVAPMRQSGEVKLSELVEGWWTERKATGLAVSTYTNYRATLRKFVTFLGHDDACRVTPQDVLRFKDSRLAAGIKARTVKDGDLAAVKSVLGWAVDNLKLATNPAASIKVKSTKAQQARSRGFTDEEAASILRAASSVTRGGDREKTWLAKRWVPWLLAYTGARVGELAQLRKQDVRRAGLHWEILITPEAGLVKGGKFRNLPLHPHLVELGFPAMVEVAPDGHLFLEPNRETGDVLDPSGASRTGWRHSPANTLRTRVSARTMGGDTAS